MTTDTVLLLTHSGDFFVPERVAEELARRGARPVRIDTDLYPEDLGLQLGLDSKGDPRAILANEHGPVQLSSVRAAWIRRRWTPRLPADLDPLIVQTISQEAAAHWSGLLDLLADRRMVNRPEAERRVEGHKLHQLRRARAAGLAIPDTLITNEPDAALAFIQKHGGDVVAKLLTPLSTSMDASGPAVHTQRLSEDDIAHLDELRLGPMCLQPRIPAREELRVAWVEGRCFVGAMAGGDDVDWRKGDRGGWMAGRVDDDTSAALGSLMRDLGLSYGGIDLIVPPDGPPVFLEVNPSGEWGMLEHFLDLPVSAAIAEALLMDPP